MALLNLFVSLSCLVVSSNGFGVVVPAARSSFGIIGIISSPSSAAIRPSSAVWMESESSSPENETEAPPAAAQESESVEEQQEEGVVEMTKVEEQPKEDPELVKIKEEIASLEKTLRDKRRYLASTQDKADEFTKTGYARKVAEMENMRRARKMLQISNAAGAMATTLSEFLPVYDRLQELSNTYSEDEFGKQYGALLSSMGQAFTDLGTVEYTLAPGDLVHESRAMVLASVHSDQYPVNTVVELVRPGWELQGNVVRFAEVVASLGPEPSSAEEGGRGQASTEESAE